MLGPPMILFIARPFETGRLELEEIELRREPRPKEEEQSGKRLTERPITNYASNSYDGAGPVNSQNARERKGIACFDVRVQTYVAIL
jgi:hypothetical protein